jgi:hypothetical protein
MLPDAALDQLKAAVAAFLARDQESMTTGGRGEELVEIRALIDSLEAGFSASARVFQVQSGHLADGAPTAVSWLSRVCKMSSTSAADRLCVGRHLESMPETAAALAAGEIGYQSASILCHFRDHLGELAADFDESMMVGYARQFRVAQFREICRRAWHALDPEGFERSQEEDFERRWLHVSPLMNGMQSIDGVLDAAGGAAVQTALEALAGEHGSEDQRSRRQRMADALVELAHHALDAGSLPSRGGVRPHLSLTTTLQGLERSGPRPPTWRPAQPTPCRSPAGPWSASPAMPPSPGSCWRTPRSSTSGGRRESSPGRRGEASTLGTNAAASPAATGRSAGRVLTTSSSGVAAVPAM